jgi:molybdopterin synthase sulfur carrier subunit
MSVRKKVKIFVKLYADLVKRLSEATAAAHIGGIKAGIPFEVNLAEKSSVADLLSYLNFKKKEGVTVFVNGRNRGPEYTLTAGDDIGIFPPIGGG